MTRSNQGARHRSLTLLSAPAACAVCAGAHRMHLAALPGMRGGGPVACPHCSAGRNPIPILTLPMRQDVPKGGTAA